MMSLRRATKSKRGEDAYEPNERILGLGSRPAGGLRRRELALAMAVALLVNVPSPLYAQSAAEAASDAQDARIDAILGMPNRSTPVPLSNLYSTAPGLEQQLPSPDLRSNFLFPFGYNSNAEELQQGGTPTLELNPTGNISWAAPVGALPLRVTVSGFAESDRFLRASDVDLDKMGGSARLQYVDPSNDQAFSPYVAFASRWDFLPTFSDQISSRQDFNMGINKNSTSMGTSNTSPSLAICRLQRRGRSA